MVTQSQFAIKFTVCPMGPCSNKNRVNMHQYVVGLILFPLQKHVQFMNKLFKTFACDSINESLGRKRDNLFQLVPQCVGKEE
jgi:hypothetical protein